MDTGECKRSIEALVAPDPELVPRGGEGRQAWPRPSSSALASTVSGTVTISRPSLSHDWSSQFTSRRYRVELATLGIRSRPTMIGPQSSKTAS